MARAAKGAKAEIGCDVQPATLDGPLPNIAPLDVLLTQMRRHWRDGQWESAVNLAKIAAPYMHAKVPAAHPPSDLSEVSDEELARLGRLFGVSPEGPDTDQLA